MPLICPPCGGPVEDYPPKTAHAHAAQTWRHADDGTILCLDDNGVPVTPRRA